MASTRTLDLVNIIYEQLVALAPGDVLKIEVGRRGHVVRIETGHCACAECLLKTQNHGVVLTALGAGEGARAFYLVLQSDPLNVKYLARRILFDSVETSA